MSLILFSFNIFAFYKMRQYYRRLCFENKIILSSLFQCALMTAEVIASNTVIIQFFYFVQITTMSYIIRRFIRLSSKDSSRAYLKYFSVIVFFNCFIYAWVLLSYISITIKLYKEYIEFAYQLYSLIISIVLLSIGSYVLLLMKKKEKENKKMMVDHNKAAKKSAISTMPFVASHLKVEYYGKREEQILSLIVINLICTIIQVVYCYLKIFQLDEHFIKKEIAVFPLSLTAIIIHNIYMFFCLFSICAFFISFFWIVRNEFNPISDIEEPFIDDSNNTVITHKGLANSLSLSTDDLRMYDSIHYNGDIDGFLRRSRIEKRKRKETISSSFSEKNLLVDNKDEIADMSTDDKNEKSMESKCKMYIDDV